MATVHEKPWNPAVEKRERRALMRVNYIAPADHTGYARAAAQYMHLLAAHGVEVHFQPLLPGLRSGRDTLGLWYELADAAEVEDALRPFAERPFLPHADAILHAVPEYYPGLTRWLERRGHSGRRVGMTVWETSRIPNHWPALLNAMESILVPSAWNAQVFAEGGVKVPIACVAHASEFEGRPPDGEATAKLMARLPEIDGRFVFYSVGTWNPRKGNDLLLRAFRLAFGGRTDVVLILKTTPDALRGLGGWWRQRTPNIVFLTEDLDPGEMAALHARSDCYVSCTRGEGWGLGMFEAAFYGKPLIVPSLGGHRAFLSPDEYGGLIRSKWTGISQGHRDSSYTQDQRWVEVDVRDAAERMRSIVRQPERMRNETQEMTRRVRREFGAEAIAKALMTALRFG